MQSATAQKINYFSLLPPEALLPIFEKLPLPELLTVAAASKTLASIINGELSFWRRYLTPSEWGNLQNPTAEDVRRLVLSNTQEQIKNLAQELRFLVWRKKMSLTAASYFDEFTKNILTSFTFGTNIEYAQRTYPQYKELFSRAEAILNIKQEPPGHTSLFHSQYCVLTYLNGDLTPDQLVTLYRHPVGKNLLWGISNQREGYTALNQGWITFNEAIQLNEAQISAYLQFLSQTLSAQTHLERNLVFKAPRAWIYRVFLPQQQKIDCRIWKIFITQSIFRNRTSIEIMQYFQQDWRQQKEGWECLRQQDPTIYDALANCGGVAREPMEMGLKIYSSSLNDLASTSDSAIDSLLQFILKGDLILVILDKIDYLVTSYPATIHLSLKEIQTAYNAIPADVIRKDTNLPYRIFIDCIATTASRRILEVTDHPDFRTDNKLRTIEDFFEKIFQVRNAFTENSDFRTLIAAYKNLADSLLAYSNVLRQHSPNAPPSAALSANPDIR